MSDTAANIVGLAGSVLFIAAYLYSNVAETIDFRLFNAANLVGAILLVLSLTVHFNLAAMVLEVSWAVIAAFGLVKALVGRKSA